jgi:two-component system chemotaxis sensor kinase CheA
MASTFNDHLSAFAQLNSKLALELVFAEPGKDNGLLPINYLLGQMEELCATAPPPPQIQKALTQARQWVDCLFSTTGLFNAQTIRQLGGWTRWLEAPLGLLAQGQNPPAVPEEWAEPPTPIPETKPATGSVSTVAAAEANEEAPLVLQADADAELLREYISESHEHLQNIELGVLVLEEKPDDHDTLNSIFRAFHTFKGGSGLLNLLPVNRLAHELESLLDLARRRKIGISSVIINLILEGGDLLKQFTVEIEKQLSGETPLGPIVVPTRAIIQRARAVVQSVSAPSLSTPETSASHDSGIMGHVPAAAVVLATPPANITPPSATPGANSAPLASTSAVVKVATQKLDNLVDLVGEMVIAQSQVVHDPSLLDLADPRLSCNLKHLTRITEELQKMALSLRMVPIRSTFQKMQRLVRDLAARQGKAIALKLQGEDTELDRTIVEQLNDPLVHMIRNAVDHGIEQPEARLAAGKPAEGVIELRAWHQGGNILIGVKDDGAGLNRERIVAKATAQGLVSPGDNLADREVFQLIFEPGFSTAQVVTDVSGRGVGMDVVRRNVEQLRGKIEIQSNLGQGSSFTIFLPLTLAIIDGMLVSVGRQRFILPALLVRESFRPTANMISTAQGKREMVNVRGRLTPLLRLYDYFGLPPQSTDPTQGVVVVVGYEHQNRCLLVDQLLGKQEVVIKSLGDTFKQHRAFAGAAILGDGQVGLILAVDSLVNLKGDQLTKAA